jgi:hypothetical protein
MTPEQIHVSGKNRYSLIASPDYLADIDMRISCEGSIPQNFGPKPDALLL